MNINIKESLDLLNDYLSKRGEKRNFVICGGASLVLQGVEGRGTADIDIVGPAIDKVLKETSLSESEIDQVVEHALTCDPGMNSWPEVVAEVKGKLKRKMKYEK